MSFKYVLLSDGKSPHTLKWIKEIKKYFDVYLISLNGISEEIKNSLSKEKIFVLNKNTKSEGGNYKLLLKIPEIRRILNTLKPDFINSHYLSSYGFLAALTKPKNSVLIQSTWGTDILVQPFQNKIRYKIAEFSLKKADFVTSDSFYMSDIIKTFGVDEMKIITFPFGLEKTEYYKGKKENIVFSNRALSPNYNIDRIIKWFVKQPHQYKLIVANEGVLRKKLEKLVKKLSISDRVIFTGYLSKKKQEEFYKKSRFFISIPSSDSTSVSLLEAMSFGVIPIVSNIPANREWIIDGVNGIFFHEDLQLDKIVIYKDFYKINYEILNRKAIFPYRIKEFAEKMKNFRVLYR
ncbi:glycosyltransferase family 4 protein [Persephonella sp.]